ncbi:hypothetical protein [Polaribacter sp. Hel_I_88]|uniref:hypothetical protein n=1 Tax=Polaribacter sp. Hel_I_88 TaxID=1250006 RepID=UPI00047BCAA3|nr:hypothetical protein [Polaribacter sp. Hel_I_88]
MIALNTIHFFPYEYGLDLEALIVFALGSFFTISILIFYYNKIPRNNNQKLELDNPIYQSKDFLIESINNNDGLLFSQKSLSISSKIIIYSLIIVFVIKPFSDFIN